MVSIPSYNTHIATYDPIATQTLGSNAANIEFTSIGGNYTDLVLIVQGKAITSDSGWRLRFNSDTGSNYSDTEVYGNGSSAVSGRVTSATGVPIGWAETANTNTVIVQIQSYANTSVFKSLLSAYSSPASYVGRIVGLWRSTSAITTITLYLNSGNNLAAGTTASLYGIKAA